MKRVITLTFIVFFFPILTFAAEVEVLHFWTATGEARALTEIKQAVQSKGHSWLDFAVAGGGGENARAVLTQRVVTGSAPTAAQMKGTEIRVWAEKGVLANLDKLALAENWDALLPPSISSQMKYDGHYVAVPVNVHRLNWLWVNLDVLKASGVQKVPTTLDELFLALNKIKKAGYIALAHGSQPWQDTILFESMVLSVGGPEFYRRVFVDLDESALTSATMQRAFALFRQLKSYTDNESSGRDWDLTTALVIRGKAGMQIMGDWAKGEFIAANMQAGKQYACVPSPGTQGSFSYTVDAFAMFKVKSPEQIKAQEAFASSLLDPVVQQKFNQIKGSIPVRNDISSAGFDSCGQASMADFSEAGKNYAQVPSVATHMAMPLDKLTNVYELISEFWNDSQLSPLKASQLLAEAVK
ncbi:MAG: glucose/mannose transport system substrate-binding protein [Psychromonas sp.]|jgi:glucose/mannose transport system substrate-binding protein|uniref:ABC transporter substrate-binding protein n=1 Tax=Psychromonas sp. TaxID=1884585 RepID=UPI0039E299D7